MENITHSLLGASLAEVALPRASTSAQRRLFFASGIIAANLPDADLFYSRITPPPLGYLLHHRGHTHTLAGCALLAAAVWLVTRIVPPIRRLVAESPGRYWLLIATALLSHVLADSWNSYGVHPFWPFDNRWVYGDSIFILEPWFWIILGGAAAMNARRRVVRALLGAGVIILPLALFWVRLIPVGALVALCIGGAALAALMVRRAPATRSSVALAAVGMFVAGMFGVHHIAHAASLASLRSGQQGEIVDIVLSPKPAQPLCWSAVAVEQIDSADAYVVRRGEIALLGRLVSTECAGLQRRRSNAGPAWTDVRWDVTFRESLPALRDRSRDDCWVRAWLQFGRVPVLRPSLITDARYGDPGGGGFTEMALRPLSVARACPPHLTRWGMPRADLISTSSKN